MSVITIITTAMMIFARNIEGHFLNMQIIKP